MSVENSVPEPATPPQPRRSTVLLATVASLALTAGVVGGFVWSGGGPDSVATPRTVETTQVASAVTPSSAVIAPQAVPSALPTSLADIVERVSPAVVSLKVKVTEDVAGIDGIDPDDLQQLPPGLRDFFDRFRKGQGKGKPAKQRGEVQGSGFVIDPTGYIVTNNHVVANGTDITVDFSDGKSYKAKLIGRDPLTDVALIKIDAGHSLPAVSFADDKKVRVGDWVLAVGNPFGLGGTVTAGIVSARGRDDVGGTQYTDYLQIDASINRGNSGGPTFDLSGRVIGMNTAIFSPSGGSVGIGFAIPASTIQKVITELKKSGSITRGWLGVQIQSLSDEAAAALGLPDEHGAIVAEVLADSPAKRAGFHQGDVVRHMNGAAIKDNRDLSRKVAELRVGETATFGVWRGGHEIDIKATIAKRDEERIASNDNQGSDEDSKGSSNSGKANVKDLGLGLATITPETRAEFNLGRDASGVLITDVDPDSDASEKGLRAGDRILAIGNEEVRSIADVKAGLAAAKQAKRSAVLLLVTNARGQERYVAIKVDNG
ncbi:MAG: Do family serine endopeptidase [Alphaproteobacteria bacterium]|nr:Do family serine endopeptidase [Alphaproteobacteria bacterium]